MNVVLQCILHENQRGTHGFKIIDGHRMAKVVQWIVIVFFISQMAEHDM